MKIEYQKAIWITISFENSTYNYYIDTRNLYDHDNPGRLVCTNSFVEVVRYLANK